MPQYIWRCGYPKELAEDSKPFGCCALVEVVRKLSEYNKPPQISCPSCERNNWIKQPVRFDGVMREDHNSGYPIKVNAVRRSVRKGKDGQVVRDRQGLPVVDYHDKVFTSLQQQRSWLQARGMCLAEDGRDPSANGSQHSVYDQRRLAPPSEAATELLRQSHFVSDPNKVFKLPA
ncbi:MAG: hypothetical protein CMK74_20285 [Pseudomonadales bacterium]|nr:hypothetical protein [Pseudomonadales bacterium]|tara:strand:- start:103 stop:627 length:525 start_codon:yes stop_codon:yes gene_type:complete